MDVRQDVVLRFAILDAIVLCETVELWDDRASPYQINQTRAKANINLYPNITIIQKYIFSSTLSLELHPLSFTLPRSSISTSLSSKA